MEEVKQENYQNTCYFCGFDINLHIHHIIPKKYGGLDERHNLLPLCERCHRLLHGKKNIYFLKYCDGYYFLSQINEGIICVPHNNQKHHEREYPSFSLNIAIKNKFVEIEMDKLKNGQILSYFKEVDKND